MSFLLNLSNIPDAGTRVFDSIDVAIAAGRKAGFDFTIWSDLSGRGRDLLVTWSQFGGFHIHATDENVVRAIIVAIDKARGQ